MLAPAFDDAATSQRWHDPEYLTPDNTDTAVTLISTTSDDQNFFGLGHLPRLEPHFSSCASFGGRRQRFAKVECPLRSECCFIQRMPQRLELRFTSAHHQPRSIMRECAPAQRGRARGRLSAL